MTRPCWRRRTVRSYRCRRSSTYASRETGGKISAAEIQSSTSASTGSTGSNVATISATSGSPQRAAEIANAYGNGYIEFRRYSDQAAYTASINRITAELRQLAPAIRQGHGGPAVQARSSRRCRTSEASGPLEAQLVQPATPPSSPSSPKTKRNVILGVLVGLVLGLVIAALWDRLDRRVSDQEEFERLYGLPVLAEIPRSRELGRGELTFEAAERFRALRTSLRYVSFDRSLRSLLDRQPAARGRQVDGRSVAGSDDGGDGRPGRAGRAGSAQAGLRRWRRPRALDRADRRQSRRCADREDCAGAAEWRLEAADRSCRPGRRRRTRRS